VVSADEKGTAAQHIDYAPPFEVPLLIRNRHPVGALSLMATIPSPPQPGTPEPAPAPVPPHDPLPQPPGPEPDKPKRL
jgi:hypothetical protein